MFVCPGSKRKYSEHIGDVDVDRGGTSSDGAGTSASDEKMEEWSLRDVIFVDHVTNLNIGSVVKLDGSYAAVHYPALEEEELRQVDISKCRLLRKEELVVSAGMWGTGCGTQPVYNAAISFLSSLFLNHPLTRLPTSSRRAHADSAPLPVTPC